MGGNDPRICHEIQDIIKNEGFYENHNFYEFCKGSVFTALDCEKQLKQKDEIIKYLVNRVPCYCDEEICEICKFLNKPEIQEILKGGNDELL